MSTQISALIPTSAPNVVTDITRRSAGYHPSIWGHYFLSHAFESLIIDDNMKLQAEQLKEKVKRMLIFAVDQPLQQLNLIDAIQRLGVSYHFESEIDEALQQMHKMNLEKNDDSNLHFNSLCFRLLRQHGYDIPCGSCHELSGADIFHKFKYDKGNFKESLIKDVQGMLSLYEATHLRLQGEDILDEALVFTTIHLESMLTKLSPPLTAQVSHALKQPLRKGLTRLEARRYIPIYEKDALHDKVLLKFAKLDFNILQKLHQKELGDISRWWKDLDFSTKLSFARNRVVECYFWILGVYFEPQYSLARRMLTKVIAMTSVIDDIYDVYGTLEELEIFTDAIQRWDISYIDRLPEYMKLCYQALLDVYEEIEKQLANQGRLYGVYHAKEAMKTLVQAYYVEAKWFNKDYIPTMDEYMSIALVSCGYSMLATTSFLGMGDIVTKEAFEWVSNNPRIVRASSIINRLMDDIVSHKFEKKRGHVASGIECYMKQYCVSEQQVYEEFRKQIVNAWKDVNREFLRPISVPMPLLTRVLNLARVMDVVYKDGDGYTHAGGIMKNFIASLLIDSVPI